MHDQAGGGHTAEMDYFLATLEEGSLLMEPHCACGETLDEDYFCETCRRQCQCLEIHCDTQDTLEHVRRFLLAHPRFHNFRAVLSKQACDTKP
jgi:hypothetical protein